MSDWDGFTHDDIRLEDCEIVRAALSAKGFYVNGPKQAHEWAKRKGNLAEVKAIIAEYKAWRHLD